MAANGIEKAFRVLTFHEMSVSYNCPACNSASNSVKNHHLIIPFEGGMHNFKRQGASVKETITAAWYKQFGTNWIIVLMFVESQMVHI